MSHVFINVDIEDDISTLLSENKLKLEVNLAESFKCSLYYDSFEWDHEPYIETSDSKLYVSGWFCFDSKRNDLYGLKSYLDENIESSLELDDFSLLTKRINAGVFFAIYVHKDNIYLFTDPFSLASHFYSMDTNQGLTVSPYPQMLGCAKDQEYNKFLQQQGHLFGNYTAFKNVFRFMPNDVIGYKNKITKIYSKPFYLEGPQLANENVAQQISTLVSSWHNDSLSLALSAGFDSRLIASVCKPKFTYTWGPKTSMDQVVAKKISEYKNTSHFSFKFKDNCVSERDIHLCEKIFSGVVTKYNPQFFANYRYVAEETKSSHVALDGYLGDVLQRGVYLYPGQLKGELLKLFPSILSKSVTCHDILKSRYRNVNDDLFSMLYQDFLKRTEHLENIDELNKVTYYEFLYGRGLRYITTGAVVMNSIYKTVVPCFAERDIFSSLLSNHPKDIAGYKVFSSIWGNNDEFYKSLVSEGLYTPATNSFFIPILNLIGRLVTNKLPKYHNYTKE